uniref:Uncharacterized protein n=1 Tax=Romanomermis culicivorax TaxID=13658 RepID=A0A915IH55_ROMCU
MACMSNNRDNTDCCARNPAFHKPKWLLKVCQPLCYPSSPRFPKKAGDLVRFAPCRAVGPEIGLCHMLNYF